jgi:hypothetical protein
MSDDKLKASVRRKTTELIRLHGSASFAQPVLQSALSRGRPASIDPASIGFTPGDIEKMAGGDFGGLTPFAIHQINKALDLCLPPSPPQ